MLVIGGCNIDVGTFDALGHAAGDIVERDGSDSNLMAIPWGTRPSPSGFKVGPDGSGRLNSNAASQLSWRDLLVPPCSGNV
jgi:hypothetical protein